MSMTTNLFELKALRNEASAYFLTAIANLDNDTFSFEMAIDHETYQQLELITSFSSHIRYRLSLRYKWDPFQNTFYSTITKFDGVLMEITHFPCTKVFTERLQFLKNLMHRQDILNAEDMTLLEEKEEHVDEPPNEALHIKTEHPSKQYHRTQSKKYTKLIITAIIFIVIFLLAFNNIIINISLSPSSADKKSYVKVNSKERPNLASANENKEPIEPKIEKYQENNQVNPLPDDYFLVESEKTFSLPSGYAAITFDDGPSVYTKQIVDILEEYRVKATFFFVGENAKRIPENVKYAYSHNMSIGSHSWEHLNLSTISETHQKKDITETNNVLSTIVDEPITLFRPPYGETNQQLEQILHDENLKTVMWNRDPEDWKVEQSEEVFSYIKESTVPGSIYLLHETKLTVEILPKILEFLNQQNIKIVALR